MLGLLRDWPCWYVIVTLVFVALHVVRGAIGQTYRAADNPFNPNYSLGKPTAGFKPMKNWQAWLLFYGHDALLHLCCTVFGFVCLLVVYRLLAANNHDLAGLVFLALVGLAGITGQLA